jgi:hypothetical protein
LLRPVKAEDDTVVFELPLDDGAMPFIHLDDIGLYVRWILNNPFRFRRLEPESLYRARHR